MSIKLLYTLNNIFASILFTHLLALLMLNGICMYIRWVTSLDRTLYTVFLHIVCYSVPQFLHKRETDCNHGQKRSRRLVHLSSHYSSVLTSFILRWTKSGHLIQSNCNFMLSWKVQKNIWVIWYLIPNLRSQNDIIQFVNHMERMQSVSIPTHI